MGQMNDLAIEIRKINEANGWKVTKPEDWTESEYKIPAILALVHSEVSEALEDFRKDNRAHFAEEIADVMIRCLDLCAGQNIDIEKEILAKLEKNKLRGFRHGGKRV
ncbi:putative NTP pyrophosphohydrolase MazG catalytic core domain-containing protein [Azospirillaceae bacterium]